MPLGRPRFRRGDRVRPTEGGALMEISIVDGNGYFFDRSQPFYDCWVESEDSPTGRALVKHVPESGLRLVSHAEQ